MIWIIFTTGDGVRADGVGHSVHGVDGERDGIGSGTAEIFAEVARIDAVSFRYVWICFNSIQN